MTEAEERAKTVIAADIRMFSGCEDAQTSADVSDVACFKLPDPAGRGGGACTSGLLQVLLEDGNENLSFQDVCFKLRDTLDGMGLSQIPQLSTSRNIDLEQPFHIVPEGCTGVRRAVMIGINYTGQDGELSGCQNDVKNMKEYLEVVHGFEDENIVLMVDDDEHIAPKRSNITKAIKLLVEDSEPGDVAFVHFSGHGGKIKDFDGDEDDGFDETLIPLDFEKSGQIRDDYLYKTLVCPLKEGVTLTCIFDCCHSGTVLDLPFVFRGDGKQNNPEEFDYSKIEQAAAEAAIEQEAAEISDEEAEEGDFGDIDEEGCEDDIGGLGEIYEEGCEDDIGEEEEEEAVDNSDEEAEDGDFERIDQEGYEEDIGEEEEEEAVDSSDEEAEEGGFGEVVQDGYEENIGEEEDFGKEEEGIYEGEGEEELVDSEPELEHSPYEPTTPPSEDKPIVEQSPASVMNMFPPEEEAQPSGIMQEVYVKCAQHNVKLMVDADDKILKIKKRLEKITGLPSDQQVLIYNGLNVRFRDEKSLRYYGCAGSGAFFTLMQKNPALAS